ncbi:MULTISPECIES: hypothetical protein [unclassified Methylobacterium]|uniref:hypothetical protein n=1 Tax=unclassified Methylobacterium TaxID=2615210 RepID=UPI0006F66F78|nr:MULTISPECIES: hypothetical protein [unclassified Methylobacterium]KQP94385.1 hypothetical protein ASF60_12940 [Methylobacterium sp. Leaf113]KQP96915.1 hypothetical protein ASF57_03195 [Methylobacterium sp. Leaf117]MCK2052880.1 hypothetical protein [Methylobacterium sp. 37f]
MKTTLSTLLALSIAGLPIGAVAGPGPLRDGPVILDVDSTGGVGGRAPWSRPYEYDSGGDNDRRPELPYYQQGRGQQTGGPARNLLPDDGLHIFPR